MKIDKKIPIPKHINYSPLVREVRKMKPGDSMFVDEDFPPVQLEDDGESIEPAQTTLQGLACDEAGAAQRSSRADGQSYPA